MNKKIKDIVIIFICLIISIVGLVHQFVLDDDSDNISIIEMIGGE